MEQSELFMILPSLTSLSLILSDEKASWIRTFPYIISVCLPLFIYLWKYLPVIKGFDFKERKLEFTARQQIRRWNDELNSIIHHFSTVMWDWNSRNEIIGTLHIVEEANSPPIRYYEDDDGDGKINGNPLFIDNKVNIFWHKSRPDIVYNMWIDYCSDRDGNNISEIILKIQFLKGTPKDMVEHIEWLKTEAKRIHEARVTKQRVLVTTEGDNKNPNETLFMAYEFHTTSTFDNFFSEEASLVRSDLDFFLNHKELYVRNGRPWTYTVLNEGPPGVGKTKLVKAIANLTGYSVIVINLQHIPNIRVLYDSFHSSVLAGERIPHEKRIYYIPEVDTQTCSMLEKRDSKNKPKIEIMKHEPQKGFDILSLDKKPTLGEVLNVLDGIPERNGHILILDTNHIQSLDPALIRPGRVDRIVQWKFMSSNSLKMYLENYYDEIIPKDAILPDRKYSAAMIGSIVASHKTLSECLKSFIQTSKKLKL
jgi:hypothetical protein